MSYGLSPLKCTGLSRISCVYRAREEGDLAQFLAMDRSAMLLFESF